MPRVTYVDESDLVTTVQADAGSSLMEIAMLNNVPGIVAECGGGCSCATCHVFVEGAWFDRVSDIAPEEADLLEFLDGVRPNSRLSCQVVVTDELDGIVVRTPTSQA